ncbi:DeoR/GlpR family DNA-binding transcription regulator [Nocardioides taihuensis]|uniref:Lactose phosphotransferase system repressor n=1 Tax=Nocardioides taihuensis TaxID=1835606 RepID=A0ABW0BGJ5_9ACTN
MREKAHPHFGGRQMDVSERRRGIVELAVREGYVEANRLAHELGVNISTVRRDLDVLASDGLLRRTHGGARPTAGLAVDVPYAQKVRERSTEKAAIGLRAAEDVRDGDTVMLDSGSTTYQVAVALRQKCLTVITNDLRIAKFVSTDPAARLLVTGGELLGSVFTLVGHHTTSFLESYAADWAFLGADAVDVRAGITNTNTFEVPIKRAMLAAAHKTVVVTDSTKFGLTALARVATLGEVDEIVTDGGLDAEVAETFGSQIVYARVGEA